MDERRAGKTGTGRRSTLLKSGSVAWGREEKGGGVDVGASALRREKEERGGAWHGSRQLRVADNSPQQSGVGGVVTAWAASSARDQTSEFVGGRGSCLGCFHGKRGSHARKKKKKWRGGVWGGGSSQ
jgi:hypothetical protein